MVLYRRNLVPGGTFFFTVTLRDRQARTLVDNIDLLRAAYAEVKARRPFRTDALVVSPEHLHLAGRWIEVGTWLAEGFDFTGRQAGRNFIEGV